MRLIKPSFQIIEQSSGIEGVYKQIELVGRTCYKSEDKITEDSAKGFVERMIKSGHGAVLEHGTVYLKYEEELVRGIQECNIIFRKYKYNKYSAYTNSRITKSDRTIIGGYVTTNLRVLIENNWLDDLQYLCEPTEYHEKRYTVKFICDRGISHEFVRHRVFSFAQESTRYCNYSKDKFGNELTFIIPEWLDIEEGHHKYDCSFVDQKWMGPDNTEISYQWLDTNGYAWYPNTDEHLLLKSLSDSEEIYFKLLEQGWKPQQARAVLPNALKTELVMTGFVSDWEHFFSLRALGTTGAPHPQAKELAEPLMKEFERRGLLCTTQ